MGIFPSRVLLAIDASEAATLAAQRAVDLTNRTGSELHVVYVGQVPNFLRKDPDILGLDRKYYDKIEQESQEILRKLIWRVKISGGTVNGSHLRLGGVAEEIVGLAKDLEADLIVMGTRGHTGVRRAIEGSISDLVVHHAHCPVMTVRASKGKEHRGFWRKVISSRSTSFE